MNNHRCECVAKHDMDDSLEIEDEKKKKKEEARRRRKEEKKKERRKEESQPFITTACSPPLILSPALIQLPPSSTHFVFPLVFNDPKLT